MPKLTYRLPSYRKHKTGQAVCTLDGQDFYLGLYRSKASRVAYDQLINQWLANGRQLPQDADDLTVTQLCVGYLKFCRKYYRKHGKPTDEVTAVTRALKVVRSLYGTTEAIDFGPRKLKAVRESMIQQGWCRKQINKQLGRVKRTFRWAAEEELLPGAIYENLRPVTGLKYGRSEAVETAEIKPVELEIVEATLPHLSKIVADMVRIQLLTGMRPAEVCNVRPCDIDTSSDVWIFKPWTHKTEHHGKERFVYIGPEAQSILRPYMLRAKSKFCFSPAESEEQHRRAKRLARKTPLKYEKRATRANPKRRPADQYDSGSYRRAIHRACDRAFKPEKKLQPEQLKKWQSEHRWSPNRLRHTNGTEIRKRFGLDGAQVMLGHSKADVTQVYAEAQRERAFQIAREVG